jgi:hypothetical protein
MSQGLTEYGRWCRKPKMTRRSVPRRPGLSSAILVGGAAIYGVLCLPAIGERGYPPIDPVWTGVTFLWVFPVAMSALFDGFWFRGRRVYLAIYSLATAFIFSGTIVLAEPRSGDAGEAFWGALFVFGPIHLVIGFCIEGVMQLLLWPTRRLVEPEAIESQDGIPRISLLTWMVVHSLICMTIGFPFAFRSLAFSMIRARAVAKAEEDWAAGKAVVYKDVDNRLAEKIADYQGDLETGFEVEYRIDHRGFQATYNRRITQLIAERGLPAWSMKRFIPTEEQLRTMLDSTEMVEVASFPHEVNSSVVLMRQGTLDRWDRTTTNLYDDLKIVAEKSGEVDSVNGIAPVYVKVDGEVIYVRNGSEWVGAFHQSGVLLGSKTRGGAKVSEVAR